jgi:hypothetical protein
VSSEFVPAGSVEQRYKAKILSLVGEFDGDPGGSAAADRPCSSQGSFQVVAGAEDFEPKILGLCLRLVARYAIRCVSLVRGTDSSRKIGVQLDGNGRRPP